MIKLLHSLRISAKIAILAGVLLTMTLTIGAEKISITGSQMDEITQKSVTLAESGADAERNLIKQSQELANLVEVFSIKFAFDSQKMNQTNLECKVQVWGNIAGAEPDAANTAQDVECPALTSNSNWAEV